MTGLRCTLMDLVGDLEAKVTVLYHLLKSGGVKNRVIRC